MPSRMRRFSVSYTAPASNVALSPAMSQAALDIALDAAWAAIFSSCEISWGSTPSGTSFPLNRPGWDAMTNFMAEFPPTTDRQATLANWRTSPFNRWAFQHVREIVPTADIPHDPSTVRPFQTATMNIDHLRIPDAQGRALTLDEFMQRASTDALVVVRDGRIVIERYGNGMETRTPHILMSVSKSLLGLVTGILIDRGQLEPETLVTDVVPELGDTAYQGATIRNLLDMRTVRRVRRRLPGHLRPDRRIPEIHELEPAWPR